MDYHIKYWKQHHRPLLPLLEMDTGTIPSIMSRSTTFITVLVVARFVNILQDHNSEFFGFSFVYYVDEFYEVIADLDVENYWCEFFGSRFAGYLIVPMVSD